MTERLPAPPLPGWLAAMVPFTRYSVPLAGARMHVMESGEGTPVVMLHGNPTWGFLYRRVALTLRGAPVRVILPDLIGLGLSDKPREGRVHTLERHALWFGELLDALGLERAVFVGQDWGGPIGLLAFARRAGRCAGLVVLNTVIGPPRQGFRPTAFHRFARAPLLSDLAFGLLEFPQRALQLAQGDRASIGRAETRAYRWPLADRQDRVAPLALARMVPDSDAHPSIAPLAECQRFFTAFTGPISIVWGDRDPVLGSVGRHLERLRPDAEVTHTEAGHFLQEEVPDTIADAVLRVVARLPTAQR